MPRHKSRAREALEAVVFFAAVAVLCAAIPVDANAWDRTVEVQVLEP